MLGLVLNLSAMQHVGTGTRSLWGRRRAPRSATIGLYDKWVNNVETKLFII